MRYNIVKNADEILKSSSYVVKNPEKNKGKWSEVFGNNNPIMLELGMGRGSFIINMALAHPTVNYIGLELDKNQAAYAASNIRGNIKNLKIICLFFLNILSYALKYDSCVNLFLSSCFFGQGSEKVK